MRKGPRVTDADVRGRIMSALVARTARNGGVVSRAELSELDVDGERLRLIDQSRGIWNPRWLDATLSIISAPEGPYRDEEIEGGLLRYDYRAGIEEGENRKLRRAIELGVPVTGVPGALDAGARHGDRVDDRDWRGSTADAS